MPCLHPVLDTKIKLRFKLISRLLQGGLQAARMDAAAAVCLGYQRGNSDGTSVFNLCGQDSANATEVVASEKE